MMEVLLEYFFEIINIMAKKRMLHSTQESAKMKFWIHFFYSKAKIMLKAFYATVPNYCTFFQFLSIIVAKSGYVLS